MTCRFGVSPVNYPDPDPEGLLVINAPKQQTYKSRFNTEMKQDKYPINSKTNTEMLE